MATRIGKSFCLPQQKCGEADVAVGRSLDSENWGFQVPLPVSCYTALGKKPFASLSPRVHIQGAYHVPGMMLDFGKQG